MLPVYSSVSLVLQYYGLVWQLFGRVFVWILGSDWKLMRPFPSPCMCLISRVLWSINVTYSSVSFALSASLLQYFRQHTALDEEATRSWTFLTVCFEIFRWRVFRRVRKITKSDYMLCHVCPWACSISAPTRRIFMEFDIWGIFFFPKICRENSVWLKSDKNNGHCTWKRLYIRDTSLNSSYNEKCFRQKLYRKELGVA